MIKSLLSILLICIFSVLFSQNVTEEILKKRIVAVNFSLANENDVASIKKIITICKKSKYKNCIALGYIKIANIYLKNNQVNKAFYYIDRIDKEELINNDTELAVIFYLHTTRFTLYERLGERISALNQLDELSDKIKGDPYFECLLNLHYASIYNEIYEDGNIALNAYINAYNYAKIYRSKNTGDQNKLIEISKAAPYLAGMYLELGNIDSAKVYIEEALTNNKNFKDIGLQYLTSFYAARYYEDTKDYKNAQLHLWKCKSIFEKYYRIEEYDAIILYDLKDFHQAMGNKDSVNYYTQQILKFQNLNNQQLQAQKDILDKNKLKADQNKSKEQKRIVYILLVSLIICITIIFLLIFLYKKYKTNKLEKIDIPIINHISNDTLFKEVVSLAKNNSPEFLTKFTECYPAFTDKLLNIYNLKNSEIKFCAFICLNFSTKDIANYTYTSVRTVQNKKYNLRKKLNIPSDIDIYVWFRDLIKL